VRVLFVCVENSCRSQMAEAFARRLGGDAVEAVSAGSRPSGVVNPKAIASLAALGYDLSAHASKSLDEIPPGPFDAAITMGCGDACPNVPAHLREDWDLPDPKHMPPPAFDEVRDAIRDRVAELLTRLGAGEH
jgi:protein-tyrosine-phosphatase